MTNVTLKRPRVAIITDSNSGISQKEAAALGIFVVPMPFVVGEQEYLEDVTLTQAQFYALLARGAQVFTSQPAGATLAQLWREVLQSYDEIVYLPMSSGLSQSCETATNLAKEFQGRVQVVDNRRISVPQRQAVNDALKLAQAGKTAAEIKDILTATGADASIYITLTTLKYLQRGGRITPAAAALGTLLGIKPVLQIQGGKLDQFAKVINLKTAKAKMIAALRQDLTTRFRAQTLAGKMGVAIAHTNNAAKAEIFRQEINAALADLHVQVSIVEPLALSIACHIGDGALATACYSIL